MGAKFKIGDRVTSLVDHMPGMKGTDGEVSIVRTEPPYYGVVMDGEKKVHKWLAEDEIEAADTADNKSDARKTKMGKMMAGTVITRDIPQLTLRAQFDLSTLDVEKRTVDLVWTTGAPVLRGGFLTEPYWEELSLDPKHVRMERLQSGAAPLLNSHRAGDISDILGVVENATLGKGEGRATVRFDSGPDGDDAFRRVREKTLRNVSVGYQTHTMQEVENKRNAKYPTYRAVDWTPFEISLLPIGADAGAVTRSAEGMSPCVFIQERAMADDNENTTTNPAPSPALAPAPAITTEQRTAAVTEERERVLGIQRRGATLGRPQTEIDEAVRKGTSLADFTAAAVDARANETTIVVNKRDPRIEAGADRKDKFRSGAEAWLLERAGVMSIIREAAKLPEWKSVMQARGLSVETQTDPGEFRGARMLDLARQSLELGGQRSNGMLPMDLAGAALTQRSGTVGGLASTSDFPVLLENVLYKVLLATYMTTPDTWKRFCKIGSVQDFRASKRYRMGTFGSLSSLNESGEFVSKSIPDGEKQSLTAGTKGNIIGITRQAIINDDMGAFSSLATMLGRAAALTIEVDVYALLAQNAGLGPAMSDGNTLFHAAHNNITAGAAIGSAAIDADRIAMASQKDPSGNEILALTPAVLVLPIGLGGTARQINNGQYDFDVTKFQIPNRVGGLFRDIVDTARITGTRRYLFADPAIAPTIEVAFLDGQQQPFMDVQNGWRVDGVEWKVREDYGVAAIDFRGAVTNAGA